MASVAGAVDRTVPDAMYFLMNGFIIETSNSAPGKGRSKLARWIGIAEAAADLIALLPGHSPSVVDRGPEVLERALRLGLKLGEFRRHRG